MWLHSPAVPRGQSKTLHRLWAGPYRVVSKLLDTVYRVQNTLARRQRTVVHFNRLKPCPAGRANPGCRNANSTTDNDSTPSSSPRYNPRTPRLPRTRDTADASLPSPGTYSSQSLPGSGCPLIIRDEFLRGRELCNGVY